MKYLIVHTVEVEGACWLDSIDNVPDDEELWIGSRRGKKSPSDASFRMLDDFPKNIKLIDSLTNVSSLLVVSERLKAALEAIPGALFQNEVLPVKIVNHKGRKEKSPYFVIHQIDHPACLDEKKSKGKRSTLAPDEFQFIKKMVVDESKVDPKLMLFRAAQYREIPLIRRDLAEKLEKGNFVGIEFCELEGYAF